MTGIVLAAVVLFFATVRWIAYLIFLAKRDKESLPETADAVRAYRAGPLAELVEGLATRSGSAKTLSSSCDHAAHSPRHTPGKDHAHWQPGWLTADSPCSSGNAWRGSHTRRERDG